MLGFVPNGAFAAAVLQSLLILAHGFGQDLGVEVMVEATNDCVENAKATTQFE